MKAAVHLAGTVDDTLINIGAGEEFSIREFARMICDYTGFEFQRIEFDTAKYVGAKSKCLSVTKLDRHMPHRAKTPLAQGLAQTIEWFEDHFDRTDSRTSTAA